MIYEKLSKIMASVSYLVKDKNVGTGNYAYKAVSDEQVKLAVREAMIKNGVVGHPISMEQEYMVDRWEEKTQYGEKSKQQVTVRIKGTYRFCDTKDKEDYFDVPFFGYSQDSADKADGKAMTYALKYMFINVFVIPSGDDPDKIHSNDIETPQITTSPKTQAKMPTAAQKKELVEYAKLKREAMDDKQESYIADNIDTMSLATLNDIMAKIKKL